MKIEKLKIGIDIDDVILNTVENFVKFCKEKGFDIISEELFPYYLCEEKGITQSNIHLLFKGFHEHVFGLEIPFIDFSKDSLNKLKENNHLFLLTSRSSRISERTNIFFEEVFGKNFFNKIIYSGKSHPEEKTKAEICNEFEIKILIEDRRKYALDCAEKGIKVLLMDKPWNKDCEHENITRIKNWNEILEKLK